MPKKAASITTDTEQTITPPEVQEVRVDSPNVVVISTKENNSLLDYLLILSIGIIRFKKLNHQTMKAIILIHN